MYTSLMLTIVLVDPKIPQNTGNIGRLCAANELRLHIVGQPAFDLDDTAVKRAGLDYWPFLDVEAFPDTQAYLDSIAMKPKHLLTTKASTPYFERPFGDDDYLIFGSETEGLPAEIRERFQDDCCTIPMSSPNVRSLNLANSVSIVLYHALYVA